jgi:hypothetical protein
MKYIIVKLGDTERPIVFASALTHSTVAHNLGFKGKSVISAGFINMDPVEGLLCFGKSISLHLKSRPIDTGIVLEELKN